MLINYTWMRLMKDSIVELINQYPTEALKSKATPVNCVSTFEQSLTAPNDNKTNWDNSIVDFVKDLKGTAEKLASNCLGLAANQIWKSNDPYPAIFVMRWPTTDYQRWSWQEVINPKVSLSGKKTKLEEGCLSLITAKEASKKKLRRANVTLTYQTILNITPQTVKFYGHLGPYARIVQHEADHLAGRLCTE